MRIFRATDSYVKKLCGRAFCSFGIKYGIPGIASRLFSNGFIYFIPFFGDHE